MERELTKTTSHTSNSSSSSSRSSSSIKLSRSAINKAKESAQLMFHKRKQPNHQLAHRKSNNNAPLPTNYDEAEKSSIERQLELSKRQLDSLLAFGNELVTNIKVAKEKEELQRRTNEQKQLALLNDNLKKESEETLIEFDRIKSKWTELAGINEPMELYEELEKQKERIAELMTSKDDIIEQCQIQIKRIDVKYNSDQEKHAQQICCLIERIDTQLELVKSVYAAHMQMLQHAIDEEHQKLTHNAKETWSKIYNKIRQNEEKRIALIREKNRRYAEELRYISIKQKEITHATRIRLEKDNEMLILELRNTKINAFMNAEKLNFNYAVLQKRSEENGMISKQQKLRIAKINDNIKTLRDKIKISTDNTSRTIRKLQKSIDKLHENITDVEKKSLEISKHNQHKFDRVWHMNFKEMQTLIRKVFEIDRILYEQQLGIKWTPPSIKFININSTIDPLRARNGSSNGVGSAATVLESKRKQDAGEMCFLRNILRRLADRGGILIEEKLRQLLKPYSENDQMILRLDCILTALQVTNMDDIAQLSEFFRPYTWCRNCSTTMPPSQHLQHLNNEQCLELGPSTNPCTNHILVTDPSFVMNALNDFVAQRLNRNAAIAAAKDNRIVRITNPEIVEFWQNCTTFLPQKKLKLWHTMEHGMNHFLELLKEREQLERECSLLRRQNNELQHLLKNICQ